MFSNFCDFIDSAAPTTFSSVDRCAFASTSGKMYLIEADAPFPDPHIPEIGIHLLVNGSVRFNADFGFGGFAGIKQRGSFDLTPATTDCRFEGSGSFRMLSLVFPPSIARDMAYEVGQSSWQDFARLHGQITTCALIESLVVRMWENGKSGRPMNRLFLESALQTLVARLLQLSDEPPRREPNGGLAAWQTGRTIERLNSDLANDPPLGDLAASVGLSPFHFIRAFKASTGLPPHRYLVALRVAKARELLETIDRPVSEIAAQVGYDDPSYFARLFRREVGVTPAAYRRARRQ